MEEQGYSPEVVIGVLGLSRGCMYDWPQRYHYQTQGLTDLKSHPAPGAEAQVTEAMEAWLKETVLHSTPLAHATLHSLQRRAKRIISFFHLPDMQYAAVDV